MELEVKQKDNYINLLFSDNVGKFGTNEILDEYELKTERLLNVLQNYDEMLDMLKKQSDFLVYCRDNMKVSRPVFNAKIMDIEQLLKKAK